MPPLCVRNLQQFPIARSGMCDAVMMCLQQNIVSFKVESNSLHLFEKELHLAVISTHPPGLGKTQYCIEPHTLAFALF